jgi:outer membrane receptor protein involved in Fe transport
LNSIPPAMIERIEVYKGVIPGHLADDALGGAINIVLKKGARNNFNASASYGSFNTTQANFNGLYRFEESGFTIKATGFYNYSDNDYEVWGKNVYVILPNGRYEYIRAKRFNDAYESIGGVINLGFTDVKWADNFTIGFTRSDAYNEVQHGTFMTTPYKGRFTESDASLFNLTYNKKDFLTEGLEFNFHGIYGERNRMINDTVKWNYNWYGEQSLDLNGQPIIRPQGAQQGAPTLANIRRNVASLRTGLAYAINKNHQVMLNYSFSGIDREDDDAMKSILERQFVGTRDLQKHITSLSYQFTALNDKLKTSVFGKNYQQTIERMNPIVQTINGQPTRVEDVVQSKKDINGYGITLSYALYPKVILLSSAERGVRLPNEDEVFGDAGDNISENPNIRPETSKNFNLGFRLGDYDYKKHRFGFNINGFYRNITDRIGTPVQTALNSNVQTLPFVNQGNVTSKGIDFEFQYSYDQNLKFVFNTSKLDLTTKDVYGREKNIPNEPFLTANASVQYSFDRVGGKDAQLNLYYNFMYVDSFSYISPLYSNNAGTDFFDIPEQFVNDLGVSYTFPNRKFVVSFDAKNIFDKQAFDNFAVQKPGRAFYLKLNYIINNF